MAERDVTEKRFVALNDIFADIVNVLLFDGRHVVREDELETESELSTYKYESRIHEQERDVAKFWRRSGVRIAFLGVENQTRSDADMPLRVIGYDGAAYRGQLLNGRNAPRHPVVTIVLYFGERPWTGPTSLLDRLEVDEELRPFVNDYKIHVFDIPRLSPETIDKFTTEFRIVAEYFVARTNGTEFRPEHDLVRHVSEFFDLMKTLSGDELFKESAEWVEHFKEDGGIHMCKVLDQIKRSGIAQGIEQGVKQGIEQGIKQGIEQGIKKGIKQGIEKGIAQGIKKGIKQGIEKGIAQGIERERVSNIRSIMKSTGFTLDNVLEMLGIPSTESVHYATLLQA